MEDQQIEFIVNYSCNLKCYGCDAYSTHLKGNINHEQVINDISIWSNKLIPLIRENKIKCSKAKLLGGEPLLHKKLDEILFALHEYFKDIQLILATNGLLLTKNTHILDICRELNIQLYVTKHYVNKRYLKLLKDNVDYALKYTNNIKIIDATKPGYWNLYYKIEDNKIYPYEDNNIKASWDRCIARRCHQVYNSRLYKCSIITLLEKMLKETGQINEEIWTKYLTYKSLNKYSLEKEIIEFFNKEEEFICNICPSSSISVDETKKLNGINF